MGLQFFQVGGTGIERTEAAQLQFHSRHPEFLDQVADQGDDLDVGQRRIGADRFGPDLVELPVPPGLGPFMTEERTGIEELHRLRQLVHAVLDVGPADRSRAFRTQGQRSLALVLEGEHLLADDVGRFADPAFKKGRVLEGRRHDHPVSGQSEDLPGGIEQPLALGRLFRQHVEGSARGLELLGHGSVHLGISVRKGLVAISSPSVVTPM